uniref:Uncharacterized protein n=1 Tax=Palpitomonas bilix TaxID=652834 RepID=A0A7S3G7G4_9EUKA
MVLELSSERHLDARDDIFTFILDRVDESKSKGVFAVLFSPAYLEMGNVLIWANQTVVDQYNLQLCLINHLEDPSHGGWKVQSYTNSDDFTKEVNRFMSGGVQAARKAGVNGSERFTLAVFSTRFPQYCAKESAENATRVFQNFSKSLPISLNVSADLPEIISAAYKGRKSGDKERGRGGAGEREVEEQRSRTAHTHKRGMDEEEDDDELEYDDAHNSKEGGHTEGKQEEMKVVTNQEESLFQPKKIRQ